MATQTAQRPQTPTPPDRTAKADADEGREIVNIPKFWLDNGILFELNRTTFHPLGYSLNVLDGEKFQFFDFTHNPTHTFDPATYETADKKWKKFVNTIGHKALTLRRKLLGIDVQCNPDYRLDQKKRG